MNSVKENRQKVQNGKSPGIIADFALFAFFLVNSRKN
jgi:hypothetical protein